ncbi:MAG: SPL family radical SAM protein [Planctomycetota bacterium]|jgi:DNA repair photolyase
MPLIYRPKGRAQEYAWLALSHYTGCGHGCSYCYVPAVTKNPDFHRSQAPRPGVIEQLKREAPKYAGTDERVLVSFTTDPYQPLDDDLRLTRQVLEILRRNDIPFQVLTKGGLRAARDLDLYGPCDAFAVTLTLLDSGKSLHFEPNAAAPSERITALQAAKERGIETWVSLEPVIDPQVSLHIIELTHEIVDHFKIGKMNHASEDLPYQVWRNFGTRAARLCQRLQKSFYIKQDLAKYLDGIHWNDTDIRKVRRTEKKSLLF